MKQYFFPTLCSLVFVCLASPASGSDDLITNGAFSSLDGWEPLETEENREIAERNSPFSEVYPDNGKSVRLFGSSKNRVPYLQQTFAPVTSGKVEVSWDFFVPPDTETPASPGWGVVFFDGENPKVNTAGATISSRFRLNGDQGAGGAILLHQKFPPDQWYHFQATLDLDTKTWSGVLRDQNGMEETFHDAAFQPTGGEPARVGGFRIGAMGSEKGQAPLPFLFDNISVRPLSP